MIANVATGGGYYGTDNDTLACIREDIDTQPEQFRGVIMAKKLRSTFFPNIKNDEQKLLAAFCKMSGENALKKKPKVSKRPRLHLPS